MAARRELHRKSGQDVDKGGHGSKPQALRTPPPRIDTERLRLELAAPEHAAALAAHFARNREHFARWDPPRGEVATVEYWTRSLAASVREFGEGHTVRLVAWLLDAPGVLVARVNFSQIARGAFHSCMLGFAVDREFEGRGLMREAAEAGIGWLFEAMNLHRVQASHRPENERSRRLLQRLGFIPEGLAREYLFIDGAWRDHVITARLNPRFDESVFARDAGRTNPADHEH